jgi:hypothetical protein
MAYSDKTIKELGAAGFGGGDKKRKHKKDPDYWRSRTEAASRPEGVRARDYQQKLKRGAAPHSKITKSK